MSKTTVKETLEIVIELSVTEATGATIDSVGTFVLNVGANVGENNFVGTDADGTTVGRGVGFVVGTRVG